jgi:dolichyl-phosphate-mannose-protein mannosyltransferase
VTVATAEPRAAGTARAQTGVDRLLAALPLALAFLTAVTIYAYQAWAHHTPWLFSDEIEYTDLSRAIAATGHPALRGEPHGFETLYAYLIAPVWWLHSTSAAYALAKYIGVVVMSASLFPAYFLARMLVRKPAALLAGVLTASAPALAYSSFVVIEPLAYTWSALTCFLVVKALAARQPGWIAAAAGSLVLAPLVRSELVVLIPAALGAVVWMLWTSARAERLRTGWTPLHWIAVALVVAGLAYGLSELAGAVSHYWDVGVHELGDRMVRYGNWAAGALAIGVGVLPVVIGLTTLARPREPRTPAFRAFVGLFGASIACFWLYTAIKAAYLSTVFAVRVEERNMIYLIPLISVGFAVFVDRPRVRLWALAASGAIVGYLLVSTPYQLSIRPYSDAPGLSVLGWANRQYRWADPDVQKALLGALAFSLVFGVVAAFAAGGRFRAAVTPALVVVAIGVLAWNLTGEISFANASNGQSRLFVKYLPHPLDWVDRATGRQPTAYIGEAMSEGNGTWSLEFWNRSIVRIGSLDNTAPGPGAVLRPVPFAGDGRVINDPQTRYVLAGKGVDPLGTLVAARGDLRLYRIHGPLRLRSYVTGVYPDGWTGKEATYSRFATGPRRPGTLTIVASREGWKGNSLAGVVSIAIGTLRPASRATIENPCADGHCADTAPTIGRQLAFRQITVASGELKRLRVRVTPPFQVELAVYPTFAPADFGAYDRRQLGVQTQFSFREK